MNEFFNALLKLGHPYLKQRVHVKRLLGIGRGLFASRYPHQNVIEYVQINTLGNSIDFGDRTVAVAGYPCAVASPTRGVWGGGYLDASPLK